ncbi:prephenate dehydratase [Helicobacter mustelae]|uniref:Bifunctional chorismate mutase/prephenate dehydratase n=1 Tax=Helicobacter mustelae (strain ATCC 43772 / CCUG 25715 / CIP 103759 / LMG 18044 / NCTC 12198 / R85-136P) TaxID=679897 RepID=D3UJ92_HELM1|nr:prephenate dehydratase [Helicobacter mustelae]CBG40567.1 chorismate mutase\prephenate dehydratase [Helicobacter mustelae 12198]SQH72064.1 chorismate mutase\prephenate dehydratase [Helicobacter mustelae]
MDKIEKCRQEIDRLDARILELLDARMEAVLEIGKEKIKQGANIYRPERERAILECLHKIPTRHLNSQAIDAIFQEIFAISRNLELPEKVAFLGPVGSYTHQAAEERFGAMSRYLSMSSIYAVFSALELGHAKYGVIPLENNANGMVGDSIDLLAQSPLKIVAEIILPIHHSFASQCEDLGQIRRIYSKDIAFGQCDEFLKSHNFIDMECVPVDSTARAAQLAQKEKNSSAICSKIAAKLYNLPILFENIQNSSRNKTRFIVISDFYNSPSGKDKTSVFATLENFHEPGALLGLLQDFRDHGINLSKIDSRPIKTGEDFDFGFYIDFEGHKEDENVAALFAKRFKELKWLGSYVNTKEM